MKRVTKISRHKIWLVSVKILHICRAPGWFSWLCPTLDFSSDHDLRVVGSSPLLGSVLGVEPAGDSFSSAPPIPFLYFFLFFFPFFKKKKKLYICKSDSNIFKKSFYA